MSALIHWQIVGACIGLVLAGVSFLAAARMKGWIRSFFPVRSAPRWHRYAAWGSLAAYVLISFSCLRLHYPVTEPLAFIDYGWFALHPLNALLGFVLYLGKIMAVRKWKVGWKTPGLLLGCLLLLCWLVQLGTVMPAISAWIDGR